MLHISHNTMSNRNTIAETNSQYRYKPGKLPHIFEKSLPIFITFRMSFSLSAEIMREYNRQKELWHKETRNPDQIPLENRTEAKSMHLFRLYDELIANEETTPKILQAKELTDIVAEALSHFNGERYYLLAYCIMPNHVHTVVLPKIIDSGEIYPLSRITYTWKRYSATKINRLLGRCGPFWQRESYDHVIRDEDELYGVLQYIMDNPIKANLVEKWDEWHGTWIDDQYAPISEGKE